LNVGEILGLQLLTQHNIYRYTVFMAEIREAIRGGYFSEFCQTFDARQQESASG
jgi:tRNA-guanine family transglycosylase